MKKIIPFLPEARINNRTVRDELAEQIEKIAEKYNLEKTELSAKFELTYGNEVTGWIFSAEVYTRE